MGDPGLLLLMGRAGRGGCSAPDDNGRSRTHSRLADTFGNGHKSRIARNVCPRGTRPPQRTRPPPPPVCLWQMPKAQNGARCAARTLPEGTMAAINLCRAKIARSIASGKHTIPAGECDGPPRRGLIYLRHAQRRLDSLRDWECVLARAALRRTSGGASVRRLETPAWQRDQITGTASTAPPTFPVERNSLAAFQILKLRTINSNCLRCELERTDHTILQL